MSDSSHDTNSKTQFNAEAFLGKSGAGITLEKFQANQQIFVQGEPADTVGYIRKGRVKATTLSNRGKEGIIGIFRKGQFFGETCLSIAGVRTANIVALEECLITTITREAMLLALNCEPDFSAFFLSQLLSRNARLEEDLTDQLRGEVLNAAKAAIGYEKPRLGTTTLQGDEDAPLHMVGELVWASSASE